MGLDRGGGTACLLLGAVLSVIGCSAASDRSPPSGSSQESVSSASSAEPSPTPATEPPRQVPSDQRFRLDQTASYDDGLQVEIAGTVADRARKTDRGAEATHGEIVIASVRIENRTNQTFPAADVLISATYGEGTDAQIIIDPTDKLQSGFGGDLDRDDEAVASVGFAMPFSQLGKVTFVVDPNDDVHDPVSFTGQVAAPTPGS